ncbi:hypothetical protein [Nonomuraea gerenzanensis]|uniref:Uncharacterized protein n=1 Tax=Nonomuraea gerenzanensis TaxID=93944 RepID=A0A1M4EQN2_9ACTN|nr:hypothetical protein [Nonomuraea gerenzanensis]UBU19105.1 hypothetical protein LCN96_50185 [Nonomuraea gerenzanensis]SBP00913.1 hypothetical protein BN4615_P10429 [Nonomuraea gerenzanensis]
MDFVCAQAGRPATALTRRDVARALLAVPSGVALVALPDLRRAMMAAGNPLSLAFWDSAKATLSSIEAGVATVGDVQRWVESTGTEPILMTPSYFVWPEEDERGPVASEMFARLVAYLEERVAAGEIDPDALAAGDPDARSAYEELQERWLGAALPDGRVPGFAVSDEQDEELFAAWDEEEAFALSELRRILAELPKQPEVPVAALDAAATRLRALLALPGYPANVLRACAGFGDRPVPDDDMELWLSVAAGIAGPISDLSDGEDVLEEFTDLDGDLSEEDAALANLCAIQHADWLAGVAALVRLGPGVLASPERMARLIAESEDIDIDEQDEDDLDATEGLFESVVSLWRLLGVVDDDEVLTPLGWWGLPKALERAWSPAQE